MDDALITLLLKSPKRVLNPSARKKAVDGVDHQKFEIAAVDGSHRFSVYTRQNLRHTDNFSCGLLWHSPSGEKVHLARYNGSDHAHTNHIEKSKFAPQCHIHTATQRYYEANLKIETFAEPTARYNTMPGALLCLIEDCNILGFDLTHQEFRLSEP